MKEKKGGKVRRGKQKHFEKCRAVQVCTSCPGPRPDSLVRGFSEFDGKKTQAPEGRTWSWRGSAWRERPSPWSGKRGGEGKKRAGPEGLVPAAAARTFTRPSPSGCCPNGPGPPTWKGPPACRRPSSSSPSAQPSIEHIIGNLVLQLVLGIPLELVHKGHRVGLVYLAGVVGGSLASSICDPLRGLVGASGGVYALIGGYFMNILVNFQEMIPLFGAIRLLLIFFIVGTDVGFALYRRFLSPVAGVQST
uniref:rhomboid protease n=1 Tax=Pogona vitticeps TaxID=103695 RepID=A0ABM5ESY1_9SAUR